MILKISFVSEYLIIPAYIGKAKTQTRYIDIFIKTEGINFITLGRSINRCRMRKKENKNEHVIKTRSQQKIIQRGANLFLKYPGSIDIQLKSLRVKS